MGHLLIVESLGAGPRALERRRVVLNGLIDVVDLGRLEGRARREIPRLTGEGVLGGVLPRMCSGVAPFWL